MEMPGTHHRQTTHQPQQDERDRAASPEVRTNPTRTRHDSLPFRHPHGRLVRRCADAAAAMATLGAGPPPALTATTIDRAALTPPLSTSGSCFSLFRNPNLVGCPGDADETGLCASPRQRVAHRIDARRSKTTCVRISSALLPFCPAARSTARASSRDLPARVPARYKRHRPNDTSHDSTASAASQRRPAPTARYGASTATQSSTADPLRSTVPARYDATAAGRE